MFCFNYLKINIVCIKIAKNNFLTNLLSDNNSEKRHKQHPSNDSNLDFHV